MKKVFFWALGIILFLGVLGNITSNSTAVKGIETTPSPTIAATATPTLEPTATDTPTPTYVPPTSTPTAIYVPPACNGTAICNDGWCSYSAHRQGTCSHHGGVSQWL